MGSRAAWLLLLFACATLSPWSSARAQDYERFAPRSPKPNAPAQVDAAPSFQAEFEPGLPVLPRLNGLLVTANPEAGKLTQPREEKGLRIEGLPLLENERIRGDLGSYVGREIESRDLNTLVERIARYYREIKRPLVNVYIPEQDVTLGTLVVVVIEGRLESIQVSPSRHFAVEQVEREISIEPGEIVDTQRLLNDLEWLNRNPFRRVNAVFSPGSQLGLTKLELEVVERRPWRVYSGYENTGSDLTGDNRWLAGFNWGNAFKVGHQFNYQLTVNDDIDLLRSHAASYLVPLPWRHEVTFIGSVTETSANLPPPLNLSGQSWQVGVRYEVPLPRWGQLKHALIGGFDYKDSESSLEFGFVPAQNSSASINQFSLTYQLSYPDPWGITSATLSGTSSPGNLAGDNRTPDFQLVRANASSAYHYGRFVVQREVTLPASALLFLSTTVQQADGNLLPSEQLGVGGSSTVRGYEEREAGGDQGWLFTVELRAPAIMPLQGLGLRQLKDPLVFLAFWDYAAVSNVDLLAGENANVELSAVGVGLRYAINDTLAVRFDYGFQLIDPGLNQRHDSKGHVGVVVNY